MLEDDVLLLLPTEYDLPDSDGKPVDNELQILAPGLLRAILMHIWADRMDWFFGINLGVYYDANKPAIGPDGFLSLGVPRIRPNNQLRLSYLVRAEKVMPQWVLEVVSKEPGGEYGTKFQNYAEIGVLYYAIYNPTHFERDGHEVFELYKLEQERYVRQLGNPVWMPELGLGIGHEVRHQEGMTRDWLYWYDEAGLRHLAPEDALAQERILRGREQLIRQQLEQELAQAQQELEQERLQSASNLAQASRSLLIRQLTRKFGSINDRTIDRINALSIEQLDSLGEALLDFGSIDDLTAWLENHR
jgi:Uma2 family endonuclease